MDLVKLAEALAAINGVLDRLPDDVAREPLDHACGLLEIAIVEILVARGSSVKWSEPAE